MWFILTLVLHGAGIATAVFVVMRRTHQTRGTLAWVIALVGIPWLALPAYWLSGQVRYDDYANSQAETQALISKQLTDLNIDRNTDLKLPKEEHSTASAIAQFSLLGFQESSDHALYADSQEAFSAMEQAIGRASKYVLLQSYLLRDDQAGQRMADELVRAADRGCKVCLLFDELGSYELKDSFLQKLRQHQVVVQGFSVSRRFLPKFRLNFRNHRKILIVDGAEAFLGGLNIGDEYVDGAHMFSAWRDTHLKISGPAVAGLQASFMEDWRFAHKGDHHIGIAELNWAPSIQSNEQDAKGGTKPTRIGICAIGPHQRLYSGDLLFVLLMQSAQERLWIATPYFVPDDRVLASLKAAGLRGVDVRVLVPKVLDHNIFLRIHQEFARELAEFGITMYYYHEGFMHQKVMLVDQTFAAIGSANFDNRSFRLNFEVLAVISDGDLNNEVADMLLTDMETATPIEANWQSYQSTYDKLVTRASRLLAPVL